MNRHTACAWLVLAGFPAGALAVCLAAVPTSAIAQAVVAPAIPQSSQPRDASLDDYRTHLEALTTLVDACGKARDMKTCDPAQVGTDDQVPLTPPANSPRRLVRYGWLRVLLSKAQDKDAAPATPKPAPTPSEANPWQNVRPIPPTTTELLTRAHQRLAGDLAQAGQAPTPAADHSPERAVMKQVLAGRDFANLEETDPKNSALEKVGDWLNRALENAVKLSSRAPWLGRALVWTFIVAICVGLVWGLLQLERRWRVRLVPEERSPAPGAASAIPWQVWLEDARRAAQAGLWREAIHFLYWASISRLESKRLWPADRARTPREYLALVAAEDARRPALATLTGSFERVWYGGRAADESDYQRAEQIASSLIGGSGSAGGAG